MKSQKSLSQALQDKLKKKEWIIAAGVDSFSHLKCCQDAGCDLILLYPTARYENAENRFLTGYLAFGNTNNMMMETAAEYMSIVNKQNVLAGINGSDPFKMNHILFRKLQDYRITGIHNYPAMSLVDGNFGMNIESLFQGTEKEIELFRKAKENGFFTCAMARTKKDALLMAKADVDILILYLGLGGEPTDMKKLKQTVLSLKNTKPDLPLLFFDETITYVEEISSILHQVPELSGYCFLPLVRKNTTTRQLELEIQQIKSKK